jgi:hypothetical protein
VDHSQTYRIATGAYAVAAFRRQQMISGPGNDIASRARLPKRLLTLIDIGARLEIPRSAK